VTRTINSGNSSEADWTDSVGNLALKVIYLPNKTSPTSIQYQFLDGTGASNYQTITLKLQNLSIKTNFACSGVVEYTGTATVPQELDIPTPAGGTLKYLFTYEQTPGLTGFYSGRLQRVTLPTGGYYEYDYPGVNDSVNCSDGTTLNMNRVASDGTNSGTWNFVRNTTNATTTVTTPKLADTANANDTVYSFNSSAQLTSQKIYADSPGATLLRTISQTWATNGTPSAQTIILEDNSAKAETDTTFDSNGLLDSLVEYDWGTGAHGSASPIRTTTYTYQTSTNYTSRNIINLVTSKIVTDSGGVVQYRQDITYDGTALASCPTGARQHDDTNFSCTMNYRGNPTAVTTYLTPATPANGITKNFTYDFFGNLLTAQLNCCQSKTWTYSALTQYSLPDSVTSGTAPTQLTTSATYNIYTGLVSTSTDENNQQTNYFYDFLRRPTSIVRVADNATFTNTYDDVLFTQTRKSPIDSSKSIQQIASLDGLGRAVVSKTEDGSNNVISSVSTKYDLAGRAYQTSNPYTSSPSFWTTTALDALGRPTSVTLPDSSATTYTYAEQIATVTDSASKKRKSRMDAAGRLVTLTEPDSTNTLNVDTTYTYTVLDALTGVAEGSQLRTYLYDALGRLTSATTPEAGTVCFGTVSGGTCQANTGYDSFNNLLNRTDARGVLTAYGYDTLNRLKTITYDVSHASGVPATPAVTLTYGSSTAQNNNGRLISMTDGAGSEAYSYNNLGRVTQLQKIIGTTTYNINYAFNVAGELTQITYPSGRVVQQSFDGIGRLCEIAPATSGCGTASSPFAKSIAYNVASQVTGLAYGNGVTASYGYSADRLQLNSVGYKQSGGLSLFSLNYGYTQNGGNNGQITSVTNPGEAGQSVNYTYDVLGRLNTAVSVGSVSYPQWGLSWTYDRYGNRTDQNVTAGTVAPSNHVLINAATNRIMEAPYAYDLSGNMTNDGSNTMVYDGESRTTSATNGGSAGTYSYDGKGLRVKKVSGSTTVYIFSGSQVIAEYDNGAAVTSPSREYIHSGDAILATIDSAGTRYHHPDQVSVRFTTDSTQYYSGHLGQYPYGEMWYDDIAPGTKYKFTTYERDAESGNDYALARSYVNRLGRFSSPDPLEGSIGNPQSLNRYSYVLDDPIDLEDPNGSCPNWDGVPFVVNDKIICTGHRLYGIISSFIEIYYVPSLSDDGVIRDWAIQVSYVFGPSDAWTGNGGAGRPPNKARQPNKITCGTVLPNGRTVGSYVNQLSNTINNAAQITSTPYGPSASYAPGYSPLSVPGQVYSQMNFKINFRGQGDAAFLGDAGNFAYAAVSANIGIPLVAVEWVAGGYALWAGHQDANGPYYMDASATVQVPAGFGAGCKGY
jgi:RHS repeat-associated protein